MPAPPARRSARWLAAVAAVAACVGLASCTTSGGDDSTGSGAAGDGSGFVVSTPPAGPSAFRGLQYDAPQPRPAFTLTDATGAAYDFAAQTDGKPTLLYFGYTQCPDVCPTTMAAIATALAAVDPALAASIQVVFVTTDPAHDTPPVLAEYLSRFDQGLPVPFVGLTGTLAQVEAAQQAAGVPVAEDGGRTHSTLVNYYGRGNTAKVAFLAGTTPSDIQHDLPLGAS